MQRDLEHLESAERLRQQQQQPAPPPPPVVEAASEPEEAEQDDDSEMEEDIWDDDGFVRVEICLGAAFEQAGGQIWCTMCKCVRLKHTLKYLHS